MDLLTILKSIIHDLLAGEVNGSLKNADFTKAWETVVLLPISRICFIIDNAQQTQRGYDKNTAVYFGLLNRINDFLQNERRIVAAGLMDEELSSIFSRIILEDNIKLQYYLRHPEKLDDYRRATIKGEIEYEKVINANREAREPNPELDAYEDKLLDSIHKAYVIADYDGKTKVPGVPDMRAMAKDVDLEQLYVTYRMECHYTHGDWFDLTRNYLKEENGLYFPRESSRDTDIRKLNPILEICYKTMNEFLEMIHDHGIATDFLYELDQDEAFIRMFDHMHYNFIGHRPLRYNIDKIL